MGASRGVLTPTRARLTRRAKRFVRPERRNVRVLLAVVALLAGALLLAGVPAVLALGDARDGERALRRAERAVRDQDAPRVRLALAEARDAFDSAYGKIHGLWTAPARLIPLVGRQVRVATALADGGRAAVDAGEAAVQVLDARPPDGWKIRAGRFDLEAFSEAGDAMERAIAPAERVVGIVEDTPGTWLVGPVADARADALDAARAAARGIRRGAAGLEAGVPMLGAEGPRRYFLAFANQSELRGTGGFYGYFTVLRADDGDLGLEDRTGRPTREIPPPDPVDVPGWYEEAYADYGALERWQNVNVTTDLPTVGDLVVQAASDDLGPLDGLIQLDPDGMAPLLEMTGPVDVEGWDEPITAENVKRVTEHEIYLRYGGEDERFDVLDDLIHTVFDRIEETDLDLDASSIEGLGRAAGGGNIQLYSTRSGEQRALEDARLAHAVSRTSDATDVFGLATLNSAQNKADWYLHREVTLDVQLDPRTGTATTDAEIVLRNETPSGGLPSYILGPNRDEVEAPGDNLQVVMLLRPERDQLAGFRVDGTPAATTFDTEATLRNYQSTVAIPSMEQTRVSASFEVPDAMTEDGVYRLHVLGQPVANPDRVTVRIHVPRGWHVDGETEWTGTLRGDHVMEVQVSRLVPAAVLERVVLRPWRVFRDLVGL